MQPGAEMPPGCDNIEMVPKRRLDDGEAKADAEEAPDRWPFIDVGGRVMRRERAREIRKENEPPAAVKGGHGKGGQKIGGIAVS